MASFSQSSGSSYSAPSPALMSQYTGEYNTALGLNQSNYQNILNQYGNIQAGTGAGAAGVAQGYGTLGGAVAQTIQGIGASQAQAIQDVYAQQSGQLGQGLVSSGLGNTTVSSQLQRGVTLDAQKAQIALANQIAQLQAGYQSSLGSAGLQARLQGVGLQAQTGNTLLGTLGNYKTPYPSWPPSSSRSTQQSRSVGGGTGLIGGGMGSPWDTSLSQGGGIGSAPSIYQQQGYTGPNPYGLQPGGGNQFTPGGMGQGAGGIDYFPLGSAGMFQGQQGPMPSNLPANTGLPSPSDLPPNTGLPQMNAPVAAQPTEAPITDYGDTASAGSSSAYYG